MVAERPQDITVKRRAGFTVTWQYKNPNGSAINVSGWSAKTQFKDDYEDSAVVRFEGSTANGKITVDGVNGKFTLTMNDTDTASLPSHNLVYDLFVTPPSSSPIKLVEDARVLVNPAVTT